MRELLSKEKIDKRGKPTTCQICEHQFKFTYKETKDEWENSKYPCPICGELYCNKPETERILMILQDEYFRRDKDVNILNDISKVVIKYAESLMKKRYSNYINSEEDVRYYADNASYYLMMEFYSNPDYKVWGSWWGALNHKARQALYCKDEKPLDVLLHERCKKVDEVISVNYLLDDGHELALEDESYSGLEDVDNYMDRVLFHDLLMKLIEGFQEYYTTYEIMFMIQGLVLKYYHDEETVNEFFDNFGKTGKWAFMKINELFKEKLKVLL